MKQINVSFRKGDLEELKLLADADEVTVGAIIRDAVRDYLEENSNEIEKLRDAEEDAEEEEADETEEEPSEDAEDADDADDEDDEEEDDED